MRFLHYAQETPWAITENALNTILTIAQRKQDLQQWAAGQLGEEVEQTPFSDIRDGVAVVSVAGPLFRYANFFTRISGATSYDIIANDVKSHMNNPDVHSVVLDVDSPGGEVNGVSELSKLIFESRGVKPIHAYVSGDAASGAYWVASATDSITASDTSALGSIGVVATLRSYTNDSVIEIVSSQSPHKRLDVNTDEGKRRIQNQIDELAQVFIDAVAKHRGVDPPTVKKEFGGGDVFIGQHAVTAGLADQVGSLDTLITQLIKKHLKQTKKNPASKRGFSFSSQEKKRMAEQTPDPNKENPSSPNASTPTDIESLTASFPDLVEKLKTTTHSASFEEGRCAGAKEGVKEGEKTGTESERKRIAAILGDDAAKGREQLAQHLALSSDTSVEMALSTLNAAPIQHEQTTSSQSSFEKVMGTLENPEIAPGVDQDGTEEEEGVDTVAKRIAGYSTKGGEV